MASCLFIMWNVYRNTICIWWMIHFFELWPQYLQGPYSPNWAKNGKKCNKYCSYVGVFSWLHQKLKSGVFWNFFLHFSSSFRAAPYEKMLKNINESEKTFHSSDTIGISVYISYNKQTADHKNQEINIPFLIVDQMFVHINRLNFKLENCYIGWRPQAWPTSSPQSPLALAKIALFYQF